MSRNRRPHHKLSALGEAEKKARKMTELQLKEWYRGTHSNARKIAAQEEWGRRGLDVVELAGK